MRFRVVPYKMASGSAKLLASKLSAALGYKVWRGVPKRRKVNINWGSTLPGVPAEFVWLNTPEAVFCASDKLLTLNMIEHQGGSYVPYTTSTEVAQVWLDEGATVFARKRHGHSGRDIQVVLPGAVLPAAELYTKYVKKRKEFRVHVFGGSVIKVQEKRRRVGAGANPLIRNLDNGWVFCNDNVDASQRLQNLAIFATNSLGLVFGAVDIVWNERDDMYYVLEINTAPGLCDSTADQYVAAMVNWRNDE